MYISLLHSFILYPRRETGVLTDEHSSAVWLLGMVFAGIAISILLTAPIVRRVFRPLIEPKPRWLLARTDEQPRGGERPPDSRPWAQRKADFAGGYGSRAARLD